MRKLPAASDYPGWVKQLAVSSRRADARRHLLRTGAPALPALRAGLRDRDPVVRRMCARILDNLLDEASIPDLVAALDDGDVEVCRRALHALACDQCKQDECRPGDDLFVPRALELLQSHPSPDVRAGAVDALARVARRRPDVAAALLSAADRDPSAGVRNIAHIRARRMRLQGAG